MALYLGIDASTQSVKTIVINGESIIAESSVNFGKDLPSYGSPNGFLPNDDPRICRANPQMWVDALNLALERLADTGVDLAAIKGLSGYEPDGTQSTTKGTHWQSFDAGMAASYLCVAANALELGTLVMGRYDEAKIKEILDLPENYDVSCIIAIGHPAVIPAANERKPLKEVLTFR